MTVSVPMPPEPILSAAAALSDLPPVDNALPPALPASLPAASSVSPKLGLAVTLTPSLPSCSVRFLHVDVSMPSHPISP